MTDDSGARTQDVVCGLAISRNRDMVQLATSGGILHVFDTATGIELGRSEISIGASPFTASPSARLPAYVPSIRSAVFSGDGRTVLTGSDDGTARLVEVQTGKELHCFRGILGPIYRVAMSSDGGIGVVAGAPWQGDATVVSLDLIKRRALRGFTTGNSTAVLALSEDGRWIVAGSMAGLGLHVWNASSGTEVARLRHHASGVHDVSVLPDGKGLAVVEAGWSGHATIWDLPSSQPTRSVEEAHAYVLGLASSRSGAWMVSERQDHTLVLRDVDGANPTLQLVGHTDRVSRSALSGDGRRLVTAGLDQTARCWDTEDGKELMRLADAVPFGSAAITDEGRLAAVSSDTVRLWDLETNLTRSISTKVVPWSGYPMAFSRDGQLLLICDSIFPEGEVVSRDEQDDSVLRSTSTFSVSTASFVIRVVHIGSGRDRHVLTGLSSKPTALAFSPDGNMVIAGDLRGNVLSWDVSSGMVVQTFTGHTDRIAFIGHAGDALVTASRDGSVRFWDPITGELRCQALGFEDGSWTVMDSTGRYDAPNGGRISGLVWAAGNEPITLSQLKARYFEPGLLAKALRYDRAPVRDVTPFQTVSLWPEVSVSAPTSDESMLRIDLTDRGGGIGPVQVFVNDKEFKEDAREGGAVIRGKASLTVDLRDAPIVPGQVNVVKVLTWNADGYLSGRPVLNTWKQSGTEDKEPPTLYGIVMGVSQFANPDLDLRFPAKDAHDFGVALRLGAKRLFGAERVHITQLTTVDDPESVRPTKEAIRRAFEAVIQKARSTDILVVYMAGHAVCQGSGDGDYCYLTTDARTTDLADPALRAQWSVTGEELKKWANKTPAQKQVMILDTCAAGAAATRLTEKRGIPADQVRAIERLTGRTAFHVLMGCASDAVSYEASRFGQGLLTYSLLLGLKGAALREGEYIDVSKLFQHVADHVPDLARDLGGIQKPRIAAPEGTSFDIGQLKPEDVEAVPLSKAMPLFLRPIVQDQNVGDELDLSALLAHRLREESRSIRGGFGARAVYVDDNDLHGAIQLRARYEVTGNAVRVELKFWQDKDLLASMEMTVPKDSSQIVTRILQAIEEQVPSLP